LPLPLFLLVLLRLLLPSAFPAPALLLLLVVRVFGFFMTADVMSFLAPALYSGLSLAVSTPIT
jgi:hypothetical protein